MSPRFEPDLDKARATTRIFDRGEYEVEIGEPQGLYYHKRDDAGEITGTVVGVRYPLEMVGRVTPDGEIEEEGEWGEAGEDVTPVRTYVHTDGAMGMTKRFLMAAYGYELDEEEEFEEEVLAERDFGIEGDPEADEEDPVLGDGWTDLEGHIAQVTLDKDQYEGREQQTHNNWMPAN